MKKKLFLSVSLIVLLSAFLLCLAYLQKNTSQNKFRRLSEQIIKSTYEEDSLSMHFAFDNPKEFHLNDSVITFPCYEKNSYLSNFANNEQYLDALSSIDQNRLSSQAKETYFILQDYLLHRQNAHLYPYFEEPLSPTSGIHIQLPVLLAEYSITSERDISTYFSLLKQIPVYFDSLISYETDRAEQGMIMASDDINTVISQCRFMASSKGAHLYDACFSGQLRNVYSIGSDEFSDYQKKQKRIFDAYIAPAYQKLSDSLSLLEDPQKEQRGLCQYKNGRDFYAFHVQNLVGTNKSIEEMKNILKDRYETLYKEYVTCKKSYLHPSTNVPSSPNTIFHADDIETYLPSLTNSFSSQFPMLPQTHSVTIKEVPTDLACFTAPAYYFLPRLSACKKGHTNHIENTIYYAKSACQNPLNLYTTLAHEGYPGHMFQNVYFVSHNGVNEDNILRYRLDFPGYQEGWAMYVELLSYENAPSTLGLDHAYCHLLRLCRELQICMLCYLDIDIHADGSRLKEISPLLASIGVRDPQTICETYSYLINEPGTYLKYYMGYLELLSCKDIFQQKHKDAEEISSDYSFHSFFLSHGPDTFSRIKDCIQNQKNEE